MRLVASKGSQCYKTIYHKSGPLHFNTRRDTAVVLAEPYQGRINSFVATVTSGPWLGLSGRNLGMVRKTYSARVGVGQT